MPKKILFFPDVYQEQGHWLPAVSLGEELQKMGHTVEFMGIADCREIVSPYGFAFHQIFKKEYPLGYTKSHQHRSVSERWKPVHLWNIMNGGLDKLINEDVKPDLIVSGYFASLETLMMYYKYGVKFMITTTYLRHPDDDPGIRGIQNLVGMSDPMSRKIMESVYSGDIPLAELTINQFVAPLEAVPELVPCPREFEFTNYVFDSDLNPETGRVHFVEPCVTRSVTYMDEGVDWKKDIPISKLNNKRVIFASAGSQVQDYKDKARRLFMEMVSMMGLQGMQDYHLVISVGSDLIKEEWDLPSNVTIFSWVPQLQVLDVCAAAYIHGGLATVKECVYKGVPFAILPLGKDQMDNALRVERAGIGEVAFAESATYNDLQNLFLQCSTDKWMRSKLGKMQQIFQQMEADHSGAKLIDEYAGGQ